MTQARSTVHPSPPFAFEDRPPIATWRLSALAPTLALVGCVVAMMSSLGAPLVASIARASHVPLATAQWLVTAALLAGALTTPIMGSMADGPHQQRILLAAVFVTLAGSVVAATAGKFPLLVLGRAMQGCGFGAMPVTMATARRYLPAAKAPPAIAMLSVITAVGIGLGYPATGLLESRWGFHAPFVAGAAISALAFTAVAIVVPHNEPITSRRFDGPGALALTVAVAALIVALGDGEQWGWGSVQVILLLVGSLAVLAVWAHHEMRTPDPLVNLRKMRGRMVLTAYVAAFLMSIAIYLYMPLVVDLVQNPRGGGSGLGASVLIGGLILVPLSAGSYLASRLARPFGLRTTARLVLPSGAVMLALAMSAFAVEHRALWEAFVSMGIGGIGVGFTFAAMPGLIVRSVSPRDTGAMMGLYQVIRSVGMAIGSAVGGILLAAYTRPGWSFPSVGGYEIAFYGGTALCMVTAAISWWLPGSASTARSLVGH